MISDANDNVIGTANFYMDGERNPHPDSTIDGNASEIIPELNLLVERVEAAASSVLDMQVVADTLPAGSQATYSYDEDLNKATFGIPQGEAGAGAAGVVADAYSSSKTYKVGDYVLHNSNLYRCTTAITTAESFTAAHWTQIVLANDVSDLKSNLDSINEEITSTNVYNQSAGISGKYVDETNGNLAIGGSYTAWDYMDISQWDTIYISRYGTLAIGLRYALYDSSKTFISGALITADGTVAGTRMHYIAVPRNGAKYIRISYLTSYISDSVMFCVGGGSLFQPFISHAIPKGTKKIPLLENYIIGEDVPMKKADTLSNGSNIKLFVNNVQSENEILFYAKVSNFSRIDIGHFGYNPSETGLKFVIDSTSITWVTNGSASSPIAHGLTIKDYIRVSIKIRRDATYDIRIDTNGGTYTRNNNEYYVGYYGEVRVYAYGTTVCSNCVLMQIIPQLQSKVWIFGDSYLSYATTRWSYYLYNDGIKDVLINAYSGQASESAYNSFKELIKYGKPQYIIWALGMNNPDGESAMNASWQTYMYKFIDDCINNGITPILCTIPNTPTVKNTLKNAFVRDSGLQYVDFAQAVNAESEGATWYAGMLSNDNTHPTEDGAKALYSRFLVDFPQIFNRN